MKKTMLLAAAVILALQAIPALAEEGKKPHRDGPGKMEKMFEEQDADKNGSVSEAEFQAFNKKRFDEMDGNKDGGLTKEEIKSHFDAKKAEWKAKRDSVKVEKGQPPVSKPAE